MICFITVGGQEKTSRTISGESMRASFSRPSHTHSGVEKRIFKGLLIGAQML
jgi:hypothetical protein